MNYKDFITLFTSTKEKLNKKNRDLFISYLNNRDYIQNFLKSKEYHTFKDINKIPFISYALKNSLQATTQIKDLEKFNNLYEILPSIVFNKEISSLKKMDDFFKLSEENISIIFKQNNSNRLFIDIITKNNLSLAVDIFKKFRNSFSEEQFFIIDRSIKKEIFEQLISDLPKIKVNLSNILKKYPFWELGENHYNQGTYNLVCLSTNYYSNTNNNFFKGIDNIKLNASHTENLLINFFSDNKSYWKSMRLEYLLDKFIDKNYLLPNFINQINIPTFYRPSYYKLFINHINNDSFLNISEKKPNPLVHIHYLLENNVLPDIPLKLKTEYLKKYNDYSSNREIPYSSSVLLKILKELPQEIIYSYLNINNIFYKNEMIYKEKVFHKEYFKDKYDSKSIELKESHALIDFLLKKEIYPNLQSSRMSEVFMFDDIKDKIISNKINKINSNNIYFLPFLNELNSEEPNLKFYLDKKDFINDFCKNYKEPLISNTLKKFFTEKMIKKANIYLEPIMERYTISKNLLIHNNHNPKKNRL